MPVHPSQLTLLPGWRAVHGADGEADFGALQFFGSRIDVATPGGSLQLALWFAKLLGH
jgi:hypothetical protein